MSMADLSQQVGTILQDPERQITGSFVLNEVAFGLENLAISRDEMLHRVDEALKYLIILPARSRNIQPIWRRKTKNCPGWSSGHATQILLLDEPLASLDPASAKEAFCFSGVWLMKVFLLLVEHRVDDVLAINPDTVLYMDEGKQVYHRQTGWFDGCSGLSSHQISGSIYLTPSTQRTSPCVRTSHSGNTGRRRTGEI